jgi:hypothetical protein
LSEESAVVVCSNPKCRREIEEPILLTVRSVTPPAQYNACPYCFTKLETESTTEQDEIPEPTVEQEEFMEEETETSQPDDTVLEEAKDSNPRFLQRFKALIPNSDKSQDDEIEKLEEPQAEPFVSEDEDEMAEEEPETESVIDEEPEVAPKIESPAKKEGGSPGCPEHFGYLANRPPDTPIPQQCLVCTKMVDCMLSPRES